MTSEEKTARQMPKGGRKGGAVFPRISLKDALTYARKLVSKTYTSAQPKDVIFSGVVGTKGGMGDVRISALRQYGLLKGDTKSDFSADELAKQIASAPQEELMALYRQAALKPTVFKKLFDTFHGDTVTKAKLKQRAADLKIHPDEAETCVELYLSGMATAGLVTVEGDRVTHVASNDISAVTNIITNNQESPSSSEKASQMRGAEKGINGEIDTATVTEDNEKGTSNVIPASPVNATQTGPRAVFNVNVTLDSSMDIEKLQKQLGSRLITSSRL